MSDGLSTVQDCLGGLRIRMVIVWDQFNLLGFFVGFVVVVVVPYQSRKVVATNDSVFNFQ